MRVVCVGRHTVCARPMQAQKPVRSASPTAVKGTTEDTTLVDSGLVAQWIARWTSNPKGVSSNLTWLIFTFFDSVSGRGSPPEHFGESRIPKFQVVPEIWPI